MLGPRSAPHLDMSELQSLGKRVSPKLVHLTVPLEHLKSLSKASRPGVRHEPHWRLYTGGHQLHPRAPDAGSVGLDKVVADVVHVDHAPLDPPPVAAAVRVAVEQCEQLEHPLEQVADVSS